MKIVAFLSMMALAGVIVSGCGGYGCCERLDARLSKRETQRVLQSWVDANIRGTVVEIGARPAAGGGPGDYRVDKPFPWSSVGLDHASRDKQIRIVCDDMETPVAVFFGEGGRCGYIVAVGSTLALPQPLSRMLRQIRGRCSVFCDAQP